MAKSKPLKGPVVTIPESRWTYPMLAAHLKVSVRTLKRYVVQGSIPQPTIVNNRGYWSGVALVAARGGFQIPGSFDYAPNARETKRTSSIEHRRKMEEKGKRLLAARKAKTKREGKVTP